jgi:serine protease Do
VASFDVRFVTAPFENGNGDNCAMINRRQALAAGCLLPFVKVVGQSAHAQTLVESVRKVRPAVVGISTFVPFRALPAQLSGTGFAVADGKHIITNLHVVQDRASGPQKQSLFVLVRNGNDIDRRSATIRAASPAHDLALLAIDGPALQPVTLAKAGDLAPEGTSIAMTGFPIGTVLGLFPATHKGVIAAIAPNASPQPNSATLDAAFIAMPRYQIYQLDLIAYPGFSGSPLYSETSGEVLGVVNATFIKSTREKVLSDPSGISFAVPVGFVRDLLLRANLMP